MNLKKQHKFRIVACLVLISLICLYIFVNRSVTDTSKVKTAEAFTSNELLLTFQDKGHKLESFIEKAIEIEGEIKEITFQDGKYNLILKGDSDKTYILCEMQSDQDKIVEKLKVGQEVQLKGILKGFLMDIILLHCVII